MISHLPPTLLKRATEFAVEAASKQPLDDHDDPSKREFYSWAWIIFFLDLAIFIPIFILVNYTFEKVLPVFAIVEDEHPPAYEPLSLDEETHVGSASTPGAPAPAGGVPKPASAAVPTRPLNLDNAEPITSSFMATWRLLRSHGGFRSIFRGLACFVFQNFVQVLLTIIITGVAGPLGILASFAASLLLVQYSTAWVHIVMTPPTAERFWRRLPPFKHALKATWRPVVVFHAFSLVSSGVSWLLLHAFGLDHGKSASFEGWKYLIVTLVSLTIHVFVIIPAYVTLVRVQASLLPDDQETIIPFDRSFQGKVEPAVIGGTGYISMRDAWATFSNAAWRRLLILYAQIFAIGCAVTFLVVALMVPQFFLLSYTPKGNAH
ncbi:hypothetical protein B0T10DRAFT_455766 [Thelonectria olida]|uniref:Ubiquitin carrier protein n=1 Tax=Thelonectria olida TaxID=1576542 RepID=A0A9P8WC98_9HYPO|nr:hypothetical protein B0T10DRAFT_455766 [Thelonectria olida]